MSPIPGAYDPSYHLSLLINNDCCRDFAYFKKVKGFSFWVEQHRKVIMVFVN